MEAFAHVHYALVSMQVQGIQSLYKCKRCAVGDGKKGYFGVQM